MIISFCHIVDLTVVLASSCRRVLTVLSLFLLVADSTVVIAAADDEAHSYHLTSTAVSTASASSAPATQVVVDQVISDNDWQVIERHMNDIEKGMNTGVGAATETENSSAPSASNAAPSAVTHQVEQVRPSSFVISDCTTFSQLML